MIKAFSKPHNIAAAATRTLSYLQNKRSINVIYIILAEICKQMDDINSDDCEDNDMEVFQGLFDTDHEADLQKHAICSVESLDSKGDLMRSLPLTSNRNAIIN